MGRIDNGVCNFDKDNTLSATTSITTTTATIITRSKRFIRINILFCVALFSSQHFQWLHPGIFKCLYSWMWTSSFIRCLLVCYLEIVTSCSLRWNSWLHIELYFALGLFFESYLWILLFVLSWLMVVRNY